MSGAGQMLPTSECAPDQRAGGMEQLPVGRSKEVVDSKKTNHSESPVKSSLPQDSEDSDAETLSPTKDDDDHDDDVVPQPMQMRRRSSLAMVADAYKAKLREKPLPTQLYTAAFVNMCSVLISARFLGTEGGAFAITRQCSIGVTVTLMLNRWMCLIEKTLKGWNPVAGSTVALKTGLHMTIMQPILCATFLSMQKLINREGNIVATLRQQLLAITVASWGIWGPTNLVQYRYVPVEFRNLVGNVVSLLHTVYLIAKTSQRRT